MAFLNNYDFTEEQNSHFLRQILQFLTTHKIIPTPINYAICYDYISGSNRKLIATIDSLIKKNIALDQLLLNKLYKQFVCDTSFETFDKINQDFETLLNETRDTVAATSKKASDAGDTFAEQAISIASIDSSDELEQVVSKIISDTNDMAETSKNLKEDLDEANREMENLRAELVKVREAARTDALTGLLNRGTFDKALDSLLEQNEQNESCLALLDLDHFKQVNDNFGHLIGDNVLKFTAKLLQKYADPEHHIARYGGEELAIIMPNTSTEHAREIAEKIRISLANSRLKKKNSSESIGQITVSIGISKLHQGDTAENLIHRADTALYRAKKTGRNKVELELS